MNRRKLVQDTENFIEACKTPGKKIRSKGKSRKESIVTEAAPPEVRSSQFGCRNCLWASAECRNGSMYQPETVKMGSKTYPSCKAYTYYD